MIAVRIMSPSRLLADCAFVPEVTVDCSRAEGKAKAKGSAAARTQRQQKNSAQPFPVGGATKGGQREMLQVTNLLQVTLALCNVFVTGNKLVTETSAERFFSCEGTLRLKG
jgi:hypothetical protein